MESPTPLSENNLRRYKGIRTSKKSLYSCTDFYLKTEDEEEEPLGPTRSVSLSAIVSSVDNNKRAHSAIEPTRMSQLETLEAKMASIEVSLANVASAQQQAMPRRVKRSLAGSARSHLGVNSSSSSSRELQREVEFLRQTLKDKENLIFNLQAQLRKLSKRKMTHGSITSTDSGVVSLRILSESERKAAEERLAQLDKEMEFKRGEIKNITEKLERLDPSDNIDTRIQQAELEYQLEREELNLMNFAEERRNLHTILDDNDAFQKRTENSLFTALPLNSCVAIHSFEVVYDTNDPSITVGKREDRSGTYVTWTRDDVKTLKRGDRIVEINGTTVISKGVNRIEEFWTDEENNVEDDIDIGAHPLRIVVLRAPPPPPPPRAPNREFHNLKEELVLVTNKLEQVTNEKREIHSLWQKLQKEYDQMERIRVDQEKVVKERDLLKAEGVRLKHRISYLEDQVTDLIQHKESSSIPNNVTVFQKGNQKTIVAEPNKRQSSSSSPANTRPPSVASTKNCETRQALKTRLWETFRRATSDSRSVCSVGSSKHENSSSYGYFGKKRHDKKNKPPPPSKPVRLSLQRATSSTEVFGCDEPDMNPGLRRSNYSENTIPECWTDDAKSDRGHNKKRGKHHGIRWPSLRPASSMSYAMGSSNSCINSVAKF